MYLLILIDVLLHAQQSVIIIMQNMLEQGPDFWCWFDTNSVFVPLVHPIHAKVFSIQMLLHFSQIVPRVCTLVLFINCSVDDNKTVSPTISSDAGTLHVCKQQIAFDNELLLVII